MFKSILFSISSPLWHESDARAQPHFTRPLRVPHLSQCCTACPLDLTPAGHARMLVFLNNLGKSLSDCFEHTRNMIDNDKAISTQASVVDLTPEDHAGLPAYLNNLGHFFLCHFKHTGNKTDVDLAIIHFQKSATAYVSAPMALFDFALQWAWLAATKGSVATSLDEYATTLHLLPIVVWLGQTISGRFKELVSIGSISNEAAAAAIQSGQMETAVEWLEQGCSVVWGQLLHLHCPVDELHDVDPQLAAEFMHTSKDLEVAGMRDDPSISLKNSYPLNRLHNIIVNWPQIGTCLWRRCRLYQALKIS